MEEIFRALDISGVLLLRNLRSGKDFQFLSDLSQTGRPFQEKEPASTFKILHSLIALETGCVTPTEEIPWDGSKTWAPEQQRADNLATAFQTSAVWFYKILARRIPRDRYLHFLAVCGYGNAQLGEQGEDFWLNGALRISPANQLDFLQGFVSERFPFQPRHYQTVKEMMVLSRQGSRELRGKTGYIDAPKDFGWFVGYESDQSGEMAFVADIDIPSESFLPKRRQLVERGLEWLRKPELF